MRRWLRFSLFGVGGLVLAVGAAVALFLMIFDPNTQKERIVDAVRRATGRDLALAGPLRLSLGWEPVLEAEDAALSNRAGGSRPQMATVARLQASIALLPLLSGRIEIESVTLDRPDILLETDSQGIGNWQFQRPVPSEAPAAPQTPPAPHRGTVVAVHRLVVKNGRVTWRNEATGRATVVDVAQAVLTIRGGEDKLVADVQTGGQAVHVDAIMVSDGPGPWPVKLGLDGAGAHVALDGAVLLPLNEASYRGRIDATIPDLAGLGALVKLPDLPKLHDLRVGMVVAGALPQNLTLHAGASDLGAVLPGARLTQLDLALPALGQAGRLTGEGSMPGGAWRLASGVSVSRQTIALRALNIATPGADLAGDVALSQGERWTLRGTLVSQRADFDWLRNLRLPTPSPVPAPAPAANAPAAPGAVPPARVFSDTKLPWDRLRAADADLQFTIGTVHAGGGDYHGLSGHLALLDGALRLDPVTLQGPEGRAEGSLVADASQPEPPVALVLRSPGFALDPVLQAAGLQGGSDAPVELDIALSSAGQTPHALASALNGHAGLAMVDGSVPNAALTDAIGNLVPKGAGKLDPAGRSAVRCLALRLDAAVGQVGIAALDLDTSRLDLTGGGTVNLAEETLALHLRPTIRVGSAGILAPLHVEGTLRRPMAALDSQGVEGRAGIVIGGAPPPDGCPAALTAARDGHPGRMPAPVVAKAPKTSDLLRSLLR